jgi:hypothetical protein
MNVASIFEGMFTHADLHSRRSTPFEGESLQKIETQLAIHQNLPWKSKICGAIDPK